MHPYEIKRLMEDTKTEKKTSLLLEFQMNDNGIAKWSQPIIREEMLSLQAGKYKLKVESISDSYTPTRWKYLYDCVYNLALPYAQKYLRIKTKSGSRELENTKDLHTCMLGLFNSVIIMDLANGNLSSSAESSTKLSDDEFYFPFVESILHYFSMPPYHLDIPDKDTWSVIRKNGGRTGWDDFTVNFHEISNSNFGS